jgi:two-component sensor histidine kinase
MQILINELRSHEQANIRFFADVQEHYAETTDNIWDMFYLDKVSPMIYFPMILATADDEPIEPYSSTIRNIELDTTLSKDVQQKILKEYIDEMRSNYDPILIMPDGVVLQKIYYTDSHLVTKLSILPFVEIFIVACFILMSYVGFNFIRKTEQGYVWVGLAKEAAHQLGTPLSSLLAWIEIVKLNLKDPRYISEIMDEMQHDVDRLNKIAQRFSKIGSKPELHVTDVGKLVEKVAIYFDSRLPNLGKRVDINRDLQTGVHSNINIELFEWVIENLLKNAAESMESGKGLIRVSLITIEKRAFIRVEDNGKGMSAQVKRDVFRPGFTTKKRGWGLGLSLCKRVIEEYHQGKIYVQDSSVGKGTTFVIELDVVSIPKKQPQELA